MNPAGTRWKRLVLLALAGGTTFYLVFRTADDGDVVQPVARGEGSAARPAPGAGRGSGERAPERVAEAPDVPARGRLVQNANSDPFAAKGWTPPPPRPPTLPAAALLPPPPPPAPTAPPVPYKFIGQIEDKAAKPAAFITRGEALFVVHVGDVIENTYRIESFSTTQVVLTYLPLKQRQTLDVTGG